MKAVKKVAVKKAAVKKAAVTEHAHSKANNISNVVLESRKSIVLYYITICLVCLKDLQKQGISKKCFRVLLVCGRARARARPNNNRPLKVVCRCLVAGHPEAQPDRQATGSTQAQFGPEGMQARPDCGPDRL